jgi:glycosyltransferase involved in cell wall biosynthesis
MRTVAFDADTLGRRRTGDETYTRNLLRELGPIADAARLRILAVTRHPELVPPGVEAVELATRFQELRMARTLPRTLARLAVDLAHTQHALPLRAPCPCVVTVHDVSFERSPELMSLPDRLTFRFVVPRAVERAARVITVSERTKRDLVGLYGVDPERVVVVPNGVDPAFAPGDGPRDYALTVGSVERRKNQLAALAAATEAGLALVVVGPEKDEGLARELRARGARLEGYVPTERLAELYRGAACLVLASRYEGFGLPVLEAMASGTPAVTVADPALVEVAGDAAVIVDEGGLAEGIRSALRERERLVAAGFERVRRFSWREAAERTLAVYGEVLGA